MKKDIRNKDEQGNLHGEQIDYHPNGEIRWILNYHHGKPHGYIAWFYSDNTIEHKSYWNTDKKIYGENHYYNQIEINI